jgi:ribonuclease HIII
VAQSTLVLVVPPADRARLARSIDAGEFEHRAVPHAVFSVKGAGVVATLYESGKLVIQGEDPAIFAERFLGAGATASAGAGAGGSIGAGSTATGKDVPTIGTDEVGKGDYFGPLVVAGVRLAPGEAAALRTSGVRDSKTLSDDVALRMGGALRSRYAFAIARLDPPEYNARQKRGKLNDLLGDLHAQVIRELARPGIRVLVDQFAGESLMQGKLAGLDVTLEQRHRAEADPAVAAASVIAREEFLLALKELSERYAIDLHKGAGEPVDRAARKFVALHGRDALGQVAKLHFKNTQRVI